MCLHEFRFSFLYGRFIKEMTCRVLCSIIIIVSETSSCHPERLCLKVLGKDITLPIHSIYQFDRLSFGLHTYFSLVQLKKNAIVLITNTYEVIIKRD